MAFAARNELSARQPNAFAGAPAQVGNYAAFLKTCSTSGPVQFNENGGFTAAHNRG
jgi:hypothetical protein